MSTIKLLTQADLMAKVIEIRTVAHTLQESIHVCACSGLDHVRAHGDTTGVVALVNALPNGQRVKALAFWFKKFSNGKLILTRNKDSKIWEAKLSKQRLESDFDVAGAMEITFADLTDERDPQSTTIEGLVKSLEGKATNAENFEGTTIPKVTPEARAFAAKLVAFAREQLKPAEPAQQAA